jgi:hypothetical protein
MGTYTSDLQVNLWNTILIANPLKPCRILREDRVPICIVQLLKVNSADGIGGLFPGTILFAPHFNDALYNEP